MRDHDKLKEYLIRSGITDETHFEQALECIRTGKVSLDKALVLLNLVNYAELGACLSEIYELPYSPLISMPVSEEAKRLLSSECATTWQTLPIAFDSDENLRTLRPIEMLPTL